MVWTGNSVVSHGAHQAAGIRAERQAGAPISSAVAAVGNRQRASVNHGNHSHINKEVMNDNHEHPGFPVITGRL